MKHKISALLLITAIMLGACGAPATETPAPTTEAAMTEAPAEPVSLRFSAWGDPEQNEPIANILAAFKAEHPNVEISEEFDPFDPYWEKKTTQVAGDQLPDVFAINTDNLCVYSDAGLLTDLSDTLVTGTPTGDMLAGLPLGNLNIDGKQVGYPFAGGALLLYYNKTMFDAAGLEYPNPSWTFQDVLDASAKLSVDNNGDGELDQWGYMPNYYTAEDLDAIMHRFGARWFSEDGKTSLSDSPEAVKAIQFIQDIIFTLKISPRPQDTEGIDNPFAAGLVGMYEDGTWFMSDARAIVDFEWDVTSIPLGFEGQQGGGTLRGNPNFVVSSKTEHPEEAILLAAYLASPKGQSILGEAKGRMPIQPAGNKIWASAPPEGIGVISEILVTTPDIVEPLCISHSAEIGDAIVRAMEGEVLTNNTSAADLMPILSQEIQALLDAP